MQLVSYSNIISCEISNDSIFNNYLYRNYLFYIRFVFFFYTRILYEIEKRKQYLF